MLFFGFCFLSYKMTKREIYKKFTNLKEKKLNTLNTKNKKTPYVRNDVMTTILKRCRGEKTRGIRASDGFRNKLMIPDSEIPKCSEFEVKSGIGKNFKNHNFLEKYSVKIYEIDPYFYDHYEKKIRVDENGSKYMLFRIDVYFSKCFLAIEIDEKGHTDKDIIFEEKD